MTCWFFGARAQAHTLLLGTDLHVSDEAAKDEAAAHELFEGVSGRRESWTAAPSLVIESSVLDYRSGTLSSGFLALDDTLSIDELKQLTADLTDALNELTAGTVTAFRRITVEAAQPGTRVRMLRAGDIVVGRFRGVQAKTGNIGYGGRLSSRTGSIVEAVIVLDEAFDRQSDHRDVARTHELGHALGLNHVSFRPSVMNPRAGTTLTDFDRAAIREAFLDSPSLR